MSFVIFFFLKLIFGTQKWGVAGSCRHLLQQCGWVMTKLCPLLNRTLENSPKFSPAQQPASAPYRWQWSYLKHTVLKVSVENQWTLLLFLLQVFFKCSGVYPTQSRLVYNFRQELHIWLNDAPLRTRKKPPWNLFSMTSKHTCVTSLNDFHSYLHLAK